MKRGHIERSLLLRRAKIVVEPAGLALAELGTPPNALHDLERCLWRLGLLKRAVPLKHGRGYALSVTIGEFDALAAAPEVGRITAGA